MGWIGMSDALAQDAFDRREHIDRFGDRIHLAFAAMFCFFVAWPMTFVELSLIPLVGCFLVRVWFLRRCVALLLLQSTFVCGLFLVPWALVSLRWTADPKAGWEQAQGYHFFAAVFCIFPLDRRRGVLVAALAAGFLCANGAQLLNALGVALHMPRITLRGLGPGGRNGGWWPEVIGGELLVGALGLHLPAAILSGLAWTRTRALALLASGVTLLGIFATGTRAAWIGAVVLLAAAALVAVVRLPTAKVRALVAAGLLAILIVIGGVSWIGFGDAIGRRVTDARNEWTRMVERGEYQTNNGLRVKMAAWAWEAFLEHPFAGLGSGGYRPFVLAKKPMAAGNELAAVELFERERHGHCHNTALQALATLGLVGFVPLAAMILGTVVAGFARLSRTDMGTYRAAPVWGLLGLLTIAPFDVLYVSAQMSALLFVLIAMCPAWWPVTSPGSAAQRST